MINRGPERATKIRQYDLLRPRVGQKKPPKLGNTIFYGQELARKKLARLGSTICYGQELAEKATKTRQYDLLRFFVGQKEPPRPGSTVCYGQTRVRESQQDSVVRFVTAKSWPEKSHQDSAVRCVTAKSGPEKATKTRQYDLLQPGVGQKKPPTLCSRICYGQQQEPPRLGSTICHGQTWARKSHRDSAVRLRPRVGQKKPARLGSTICYGQELARKSHQNSAVRFVTTNRHRDSAVRFVTVKRGPEKPPKTRQYDLLRPNVGQKEPPRLGSTICYGQELARKSRQDSAVRCVTAKSWPERATKTRQYDLLRPRVGQKEPPRLGSTICYGQTWARKSHQDSAIRFVTAKSRPNVGQKEPPKLGSTMRYDQTWARKSHQDSAVRFVTAKSWPQKATKTRQYDLLRPRVGQKKPPRLGNTICYGQELARKSHQDSAVRIVTAKRGPERATKIRQCDLLRPRVG